MAEPIAPTSPPVEPEASTPAPNPNRRAFIILGVVAAAALLFLLVVRPLLFGGDDGGNQEALPPPSPAPSQPAGGATTTTIAGVPPVETFEVFGSKNPFQPPNGVPGGEGTTASTTPGGTTETTIPGGTTGTTIPGTNGGASGSGTEPRVSQRVALLDVYQVGGVTVADVRVVSTVYTELAPGEEFAGSYKVVSLEGTCGSFLFGDERFRLCKGEEVLK
jgi:hypothetical protein